MTLSPSLPPAPPPVPTAPQRIACLSTEAVEVLYRLGAQDRVAGISGYTVHPPEARAEKSKISGFSSMKIERILAVQPDLVIGFSDLQKPLLAACEAAGLPTLWFDQRDIAGIHAMVRRLAALVQREAEGEQLCAHLLAQEQPGASKGGRTIDPAPYDGNELGADFALLRPPLKEFTVLGGMMVNRKDIDALVGRFRSLANFKHSAKLLIQYGLDRLRHPRGARLLMGNALAGRLLKSARQAGVDIRTQTPAGSLIVKDGTVIGLTVKGPQGERCIGARRGVVLASGGFPANAVMRGEHMPHAEVHRSMAPKTDTGDGINLGLATGGALRDDNIGAAFWTPVSVLKKPDGSEVQFPHLILDRAKPGLIAVDGKGNRFVNEATSYHGFVEAMHASGAVPAFLVCDSVFLHKYGLGLVHPGLKTPKAFVEAGYLFEGDSIAALAGRIGVPMPALAAAVAGMNDAARSGSDAAFGKGSSEYNRYLGDPNNKPNPCLGPIETGPFYAVKVWPGDIGTATGLTCDPQARVLGRDERPVAGLYATGNDMNSIMAGAYPGAGITLGPALTFGFIAGRALAAETDHLPR